MPESFDLHEQRNITAELNKQLNSLKDAKAVYSTIRDFASSVSDELKTVTNELDQMAPGIRDINTELNEVVESVLTETTRLVKNYQNLGSELFDQVDIQSKLVELEEIKNKVFSEYFGQNSALKDLLLERIGIIEDEINALNSMSKQQDILNDRINVGADHIMNMFDRIQGGIEGLPGGSFLTSVFGFDKLREQFRTGVVQGLKKATLEMGGLSTGMLAALTGVVVLLSMAVSRFLEIDSVTRDIRNQTGFIGKDLNLSIDKTVELNREFQEYGLGLEESRDVLISLVDEYGSLSLVSKQVSESTALMSQSLGLSSSEAAGLVRIFDTLAAVSGETLDSVEVFTIQLAQAAHVAPQQVMKDIAESGDTLYTVMGGSAREIAKAAVYARQLGTSLGTMTDIAEGLLDFETSIEGAMEASVILQRNINFERARSLAYWGRTKEAVQSVLDELGGVSEFQNLTPIQLKAISKALGISAGKLIGMVQEQERLNLLTDNTLSTYEKFSRGATLSEVLNASDVMTPLEELENQFKTLIVELAQILVPVIKLLASMAGYVAAFLKDAREDLKFIGKIISSIFNVSGLVNSLAISLSKNWDNFVNILSNTGSWIIKITKFTFSFLNSVGESIRSLFVGKVGQWVTKATKFVFLFLNPIGLLITSTKFLIDHWDNFKNLLSDVGESIRSFFVDKFGSWIQVAIDWVNRFLGVFGKIAHFFGFGETIPATVNVRGNTSAETTAVVRAASQRNNIFKNNNGVDMGETNKKLDRVVDLLGKSKDINMDGRKVGVAIAVAAPSL